MVDGLAVVDKPSGMTSHDVVGRCRRIFGQKRVGHAGTLDPDATGVLLVGLGRATRLLRYMSGLPKSYSAEVVLGIATTTLDSSGEVVDRWDQTGVTLEAARQAAATLTGTIDQVPPMVSALKVGGKRLHQLARAGIDVQRNPRQVTVTRFDIDTAVSQADTGLAGAGPVLSVRVDCSAGTYVRVLGADLGIALGGGAHIRNLRRTAVGPWKAESATPLEALGVDDVLAPVDSLPWMPSVTVGEDLVDAIGHGKVLHQHELGGDEPGPWRVVGPSGDLLAVYEAHAGGRAKPTVVLAPA